MIEYICKTIATLGICGMCAFISSIEPFLGCLSLIFGAIVIGIIWES